MKLMDYDYYKKYNLISNTNDKYIKNHFIGFLVDSIKNKEIPIKKEGQVKDQDSTLIGNLINFNMDFYINNLDFSKFNSHIDFQLSSDIFKNIDSDKKIYLEKLIFLAYLSLIKEVTTTPKPGLVDLYNNGSHKDMDLLTFLNSSLSLVNYFKNIVYYFLDKFASFNCNLKKQNSKEIIDLFYDEIFFTQDLMDLGKDALDRMYYITNDVNTHKGAIFNLGITFASVVYLYLYHDIKLKNMDDILLLRRVIGVNSKYYFNNLIDINKIDSKGTRVRQKYNKGSITYEVTSGYKTLYNAVMFIFKDEGLLKIYRNSHENSKNILILLSIMRTLIDSNILSRGSLEDLIYIKRKAGGLLNEIRSYNELLLKQCKDFSWEKIREYIQSVVQKFDGELISKNLSPGGAADLLSIFIFINSIITINKDIN